MRRLAVNFPRSQNFRIVATRLFRSSISRAMRGAAEPISLLTLGLRPRATAGDNAAPAAVCRVLVCGDGDFSYGAALVKHLAATHRRATVVATCFLDGYELAQTHPLAADHAAAITSHGPHVALAGVDATRLAESLPAALEAARRTATAAAANTKAAAADGPAAAGEALAGASAVGVFASDGDGAVVTCPATSPHPLADLPGVYDRIVWNFPQHPERKKIQNQRALLLGFFASAAPLLAPGGSVWLTLKGGQGGSGAEEQAFAGRPPGTTWQCQEQVRMGGGGNRCFFLKGGCNRTLRRPLL